MQKGKTATSPPAMVIPRGPSQQNARGPPSSQQRAEDFNQRPPQTFPMGGQMQPNVVMGPLPNQLQGPPGQQSRMPNQPFFPHQRPMRMPRHQTPNNPPLYSSPPSGQFVQFVNPQGAPQAFIPPGQGHPQYHVDYGQIPGPPQMQYRHQQPMPGPFPSVSGPSQGPGHFVFTPQQTGYPVGQPSHMYILRATPPPMNTLPQYSPSQNFEPRARERKIIQIKDPNSNKDVTQEILNRQPSGSVSGSATGSTGGTPTNTPDISGQSSRSSTPPLTSQQQDMRAQFAAQVAATLSSDTDKNKKPGDIIIQKPSVNNKLTVGAPKLKSVADTSKDYLSRQTEISANMTAVTERKLAEQLLGKKLGKQVKEESKSRQPKKQDNQQVPKVELTLEGSVGEEIMLKAPQSESAEVEEMVNGHEAKAKTASVTKNSTDVQGAEASFPDLDEKPKKQDGERLTYERDFLLQFQTHPMCMLKPEGLPDLEIVLRQARTPSRSRFSQNRMQPKDGGENMFLPAYLRQNSRQLKRTKKR